jgi:hypothetical protein
MPRFTDDALREFAAALEEVRSSISFIGAAMRLRPRLGKLIAWDATLGEAKTLITDFINQRLTDPVTPYRGLLVIISGAFEQLVARLVRDSVAEINARIASYDAIPNAVRDQNIYRTGQAFLTIKHPVDHISIDYGLFSRNIGSCQPGATEFTLNAEAFTTTMKSVTPTHLGDVLTRIGFDLKWDDLGRVTAMQKHFGKTRTRETADQIQSELASFAKQRNRIAHTGSGGVTLTEGDLVNVADFLQIFASNLAILLSNYVGQLKK